MSTPKNDGTRSAWWVLLLVAFLCWFGYAIPWLLHLSNR